MKGLFLHQSYLGAIKIQAPGNSVRSRLHGLLCSSCVFSASEPSELARYGGVRLIGILLDTVSRVTGFQLVL
jgi:hypothetical protein